MTCSTCGERRVVMITESVVINGRRVTWSLCVACWIRERQRE